MTNSQRVKLNDYLSGLSDVAQTALPIGCVRCRETDMATVVTAVSKVAIDVFSIKPDQPSIVDPVVAALGNGRRVAINIDKEIPPDIVRLLDKTSAGYLAAPAGALIVVMVNAQTDDSPISQFITSYCDISK